MTDADAADAILPPPPPASGAPRVLRWTLFGCGIALIVGSLGAAYWGFRAMEEVRSVSTEAVAQANLYMIGSEYLAGELGTLTQAGPSSSEPVTFRPGGQIDVEVHVEGARGCGSGVVWIRRVDGKMKVSGCEITTTDGRKLHTHHD